MEKGAHAQLAGWERDNWWFRARRDLLDGILSRYYPGDRDGRILDAGCGVGSNFDVLARYSSRVYGIDSSPDAIAFCSSKGYRELAVSSILEAGPGIAFDAIVCMDVLEHLEDDAQALSRLRSLLRENGILVLSVPAHPFLRGENDEFLHHKRRYRRAELEKLVRGCGLSLLKIGYWNQGLLIPVLLNKLAGLFVKRKVQNNLDLVPPVFNYPLYRLLTFENLLFFAGGLVNGVSLVCVARNGRIAKTGRK